MRERVTMGIAENALAGLIGAIVLLFLQWIWKDVMPSIFIRFQKNEPRIAGKWRTSFDEEGKAYTEKVTLKQRGRKLKGTIVLKDGEEEIIYDFIGTFQNLILSGVYASTDQANFERGAVLLQYTSKNAFVGQQSFFSKKSERLVSSNYEWHRV